MPYDEADSTDPMTLYGMGVETDDANTQREMAACFIEEFLRTGYDRSRLLDMFKDPRYFGPHMAYEALGEKVLIQLIDEMASLWGARRGPRVVERSTNGDTTPA